MVEELKQEGKTMSIKGVAQSNARVSEYMENLDGSEWLQNPKLQVITTLNAKDSGSRLTQSTLSVAQQEDDKDKDKKADKGEKDKKRKKRK